MIVHCFATKYATAGRIDPDNWVDNRGGSNKNFFMRLVRELPRHGHRVRSFSTYTHRTSRAGVEYYPIAELDSYGEPDALWACYDTTPLEGRRARLRVGSHHTFRIDRAAWADIDVHTVPCQWALDSLRWKYAPRAAWRVQPNAVEDDVLSIERRPVPGRVLYHTSWSRGLRILLRVWPEVRRRVPGAALSIIATLPDRAGPKRPAVDLISLVEAEDEREFWENWDLARAAGGVEHAANVPRARVLRELAAASCFAFPCSVAYPVETFSVAAMECCRAGVPVVLAPADALGSIYEGHVRMTPAPAGEYAREFADALVDVLNSPDYAARLAEQGRELARPYTYENAGVALDRILREGMEKR